VPEPASIANLVAGAVFCCTIVARRRRVTFIPPEIAC
jgi:hypothetical protein